MTAALLLLMAGAGPLVPPGPLEPAKVGPLAPPARVAVPPPVQWQPIPLFMGGGSCGPGG